MKNLERRAHVLNQLLERRRDLESILLGLDVLASATKVHDLKRQLAFVRSRIARLEKRLK